MQNAMTCAYTEAPTLINKTFRKFSPGTKIPCAVAENRYYMCSGHRHIGANLHQLQF